jgi:hypothetical protein
MKSKVPQEVTDAFEVLEMRPEFKKVLAWLEESLADTRLNNDTLTGIDLTRSQGEAIVIAKIIRTAKGRS